MFKYRSLQIYPQNEQRKSERREGKHRENTKKREHEHLSIRYIIKKQQLNREKGMFLLLRENMRKP